MTFIFLHNVSELLNDIYYDPKFAVASLIVIFIYNTQTEYRELAKEETNFFKIFFYVTFIIYLSILTIIVGILKETYATIGYLYEDEILSMMKQADGYTSNLDVVLPFIFKYSIPIFAATGLLMYIYYKTTQNEITIFKIFSFRLSISYVLIIYLISCYLHFVKILRPDVHPIGNFLKDNAYLVKNQSIIFPDKKKNLLIFALEGFEITFASKKNGGAFDTSYMPYLESLAADKNNIHFTQHKDGKFGGPQYCGRIRLTSQAHFAMTCGYPLIDNFERFKVSGGKIYMSKVTCLGDVMSQNGYETSVVIPSWWYDWGLGGIFEYHGFKRKFQNTDIKKTAIKWVKDKYTFDFIKKELTELYKIGKPFYLHTMNMDTHEKGILCDLCPDAEKGENNYHRVYKCFDKQFESFHKWLQQQPFYNDTVIILIGDHLSRDPYHPRAAAKAGVDRRTYNLIINSDFVPLNRTGRSFTNLDIYPTALGALGAKVYGEQIGLGTNMFSNRETMEEEFGLGPLENEFGGLISFYHTVVEGGQAASSSCDSSEPCVMANMTQL
ncbi:Sulfatase family protein [Trichomonas vaginalis G3]|uniref:Sulfatase family protein n=1 Tax=Trichomonas vaginalis (strain ATCC PRA-98 / G3) TaxID=412133 RepID=A2DGM8_TRIV3|nr:lipoteichoic acid synthase family [Trichomonas vaginalis G3]EAY20415.1 Sulfatase family protein [Trichomonas vaginalis G3]KAI5490539.1 lipoteichoic acid synthase family [Trichomonas vaginalis G3]|eukprot:XP_001581401.1 Sulfatase family protein [Trichomonas vaginalis G3]